MEDQAQQAARCVLWHAAPPPLLAALGRRRVIMTETSDPYRALATLCRLHSVRGGGPVQGVPPVLLLVEPSGRAGAADLVRAAWTYAPRAVVWMYEVAANPQLRAVVESDVERWDRPVTSDNGFPAVVVVPGGGLDGPGTIARIGGPGMGAGPRARENIAPRRAPTLRLSDDSEVEREPVRDDDLGPGEAESRAKPRPLLSAEELEMLLTEQPEQDRGHG